MVGVIILNDITIGYKKKKVLEHISYKFEDNGMYAIVGESGIGKTTLLSTIANLKKDIFTIVRILLIYLHQLVMFFKMET